MNGKLNEECGVLGLYDFEGENVAHLLHAGLYALQHRGQQSCGIVTNDDAHLHQIKDNGTVAEVFNEKNLATLTGTIGVAHARYAPGGDIPENAQPLVSRYCKGSITLAHNGNIINVRELREELEAGGAIFQSTNDTEVIMHLIAIARTKLPSVEAAMLSVMNRIEGAYSMVLMSPRKLMAIRDPQGFRPLCIGKRGKSWIFASESCALAAMGARFVRDVKPGELVLADRDGNLVSFTEHCGKCKPSICAFEYFYFARPDSVVDGIPVCEARVKAGRLLARSHPADADIVIGVPDSGTFFALGYSYESGIPYGVGLISNSYALRFFPQKKDEERALSLSVKMSAVRSAVENKRVVVVDDSIVRGATAARIVKLIREGGAKEVHVRIACPPFLFPCYYGTDIPAKKELPAVRYTVDEIKNKIGADSLGYLPVEMLPEIGLTKDNSCYGCFTGEYPVRV